LLMFRSVVAAGLPVLVAVAGLAVGGAGITVLCGVMDVSPYAPMVASMVGLGVGIDYALLLLTRTRDGLAAGLPVVEASARAGPRPARPWGRPSGRPSPRAARSCSPARRCSSRCWGCAWRACRRTRR